MWISVQSFLFLLPIIIGLVFVPYNISYDQKYVDNVNIRAFEYEEGKITDFSEAQVKKQDADGKYIRKEWKLENKELYYFDAILLGSILGFFLQIGNVFWGLSFSMREEDD